MTLCSPTQRAALSVLLITMRTRHGSMCRATLIGSMIRNFSGPAKKTAGVTCFEFEKTQRESVSSHHLMETSLALLLSIPPVSGYTSSPLRRMRHNDISIVPDSTAQEEWSGLRHQTSRALTAMTFRRIGIGQFTGILDSMYRRLLI